MHERSQLRSDRLGWHPGRVFEEVSRHTRTIQMVRVAGIGDHQTEWTSADGWVCSRTSSLQADLWER